MNPKDGEKGTFAAVDLPMKRKRGRPRKSEGSPTSQTENPDSPDPPTSAQANEQNSNIQESDVKVHSGGNKEVPVSDSSGSLVGQVAHGVIDADFGDGYAVSAVVGGINLRGIVLKVGRVVPVSAANDVAPSAKMIKRHGNGIPYPNAQVESEATAARNLKDTASRKVTETGDIENRPVEKEAPALPDNTDEDMEESGEELNSGSTSESPRELPPGNEAETVNTDTKSEPSHQTQEGDNALNSGLHEPVHTKDKEPDAELKQAPEQMSSSPKSPAPDAIVEAVQEEALDSKSKFENIASDNMEVDPKSDQIPAPEEPKVPEKTDDNSDSQKPDSFDEMSLTLGLNQPFCSSEVQNYKPAGPEPKKSGLVHEAGFNLNIGTCQTPPTSPTNTRPMMSLKPDLGLAGHSLDDGTSNPLPKESAVNITRRDYGSAFTSGHADVDTGSANLAEGSVAP